MYGTVRNCVGNILLAAGDNPFHEFSQYIGDTFNDVLGHPYLSGAMLFLFLMTLMLMIGLRGTPLFVLMVPTGIASAWFGGWPSYAGILMTMVIGLIIGIGLLRLIRR